jgi:hypothetical protein
VDAGCVCTELGQPRCNGHGRRPRCSTKLELDDDGVAVRQITVRDNMRRYGTVGGSYTRVPSP